jgi:hypothetical protein
MAEDGDRFGAGYALDRKGIGFDIVDRSFAQACGMPRPDAISKE